MPHKDLRKDRIEKKLTEIVDTIDFISENLTDSFENFSESRILKDAIYKNVEFVIQNIIDICFIINSDLRLGIPEVEDDVFRHLKQRDIFSKKIIGIIEEMKSFRNILVHKYGEIDDKKAFENIKEGIKDFELIVSEIEDFLKSQNSSKKEKSKHI